MRPRFSAIFGAPAALAVALMFGLRPGFAQECSPAWDNTLSVPGMNSPVNAILAVGGPASTRLYAAGRFTTAGGVAAAKIAAWNGTGWTALGSGIGGVGPVVHALTSSPPGFGGLLFAGGEFTSAGGVSAKNIARWDGASWSALTDGVNGPVYAMTVHNDGGGPVLFVGGAFTQAGDVAAKNIAIWDGTQWWPLGAGADQRVLAMTVYDDGGGRKLYVAGDFTMIGAIPVQRIARWDGAAWSAVGGGFNNSVFALAVFEDGFGPGGACLFAGGSFTQNGGAFVSSVARWDGASWFGLGAGTNGTVRALAVFDEGAATGRALYVGGGFTSAGALAANRIARWDGSAWSTLGVGLNDPVFALAGVGNASDIGPALYVGGSLTSAGNAPANYIARWEGCPVLPADMNRDGRLSLTDLASLVGCVTGPGGGNAPPCARADTDSDLDADLLDFSRFADSFTGP